MTMSTHTADLGRPLALANIKSIHPRRPWPAARSATRVAFGNALSMRLATSQVSKSSFRGNTSAEHTAAATFANRGGEKPFSNVSMSRRRSLLREPCHPARRGGPVGRSFGRKTTLRAAIIYIMTLQASACGEIIYVEREATPTHEAHGTPHTHSHTPLRGVGVNTRR